ncbi:MAG: hypothetical protein ACBR14_29105 [Microcoleus sp.]
METNWRQKRAVRKQIGDKLETIWRQSSDYNLPKLDTKAIALQFLKLLPELRASTEKYKFAV